MKLLIVTQAVDENDLFLSFFVRWIAEIAKHAESVQVICLTEGKHSLPANVRVYSLGKERGPRSRAVYAFRFLSLVWRLHRDYDTVLVHMNQEYILIAGWLWTLLGKPVFLWRNHYAGSWITDVAAAFCKKVFCTSKYSYTAAYKKTVLMPVGVDTQRFFPDAHVPRPPRSILFFARLAPSKRPEILIDALAILKKEQIPFTASIVGSPLPKDASYYEKLKQNVRSLGLSDLISFLPGVPNSEAPDLYRSHEIFVNTSRSGMLDKMIFEAAASGCVVLAASEDFAQSAGREYSFSTAEELAAQLRALLTLSPEDRERKQGKFGELARSHSLEALAAALVREV